MYEPLSDRARKVVQLANQEASKFNHSYIGTEHILLGLLNEGSGTAIEAMKNLGVNLRRLRSQVQKLILRSAEPASPGGKLPQTPRTRKAIENAMEECRKLKHMHVGTEHLLLGLLREEECVASQLLANHRLCLDQVREEIVALQGDEPSPPRAT